MNPRTLRVLILVLALPVLGVHAALKKQPDPSEIAQLRSQLTRSSDDAAVMGGRPCIRGMRVTVGSIVGLLATGQSPEQVLAAYPYLELEDIQAALAFAAWRLEEVDLPLKAS